MDTLVIDNKLYRFNTEYENTDDLTRRAQLKAISEKLKGRNLNNIEKFNQILNNIQTKQNNKPYHRLNLFQKEQIIKDFVKEKWGDDKVESYTKQILKFIENKKIVTANVVYNVETGTLENIKNIIIEDGVVCIKTKGAKTKGAKTKDTKAKNNKKKKDETEESEESDNTEDSEEEVEEKSNKNKTKVKVTEKPKKKVSETKKNKK